MAANSIITKLANIFQSPSYADRIPEATRQAIKKNGFGNMGVYSQNQLNDIYGALINTISKQNIYSFKYSGIDIERYNKGFITHGDVIIDTFIDVADVTAIPTPINAEGDNSGVTTVDPYVIKWANIKTGYYQGDYSLHYHVTTMEDLVKKAFISDSNMTSFVAQCRAVLPESLKLDRYLIFRNLLAADVIYKVTKDFEVALPDPDRLVFSQEDAMNIISTIKTYSESLENNTAVYNRLGATSNTEKEFRVLFINKGIYNALKTSLKNVYHNEIDFGVGRIEEIPDFGETASTSGQFASIVDERGLMLYDTLRPYEWTIFNGAGPIYWNTFLNYRGKIFYALHRNAVRFTLSEKSA